MWKTVEQVLSVIYWGEIGHVTNQTYLGFQPLSVGEGEERKKTQTERGHVKMSTSERISKDRVQAAVEENDSSLYLHRVNMSKTWEGWQLEKPERKTAAPGC